MGNRVFHLMHSAAESFIDFVLDVIIGIFL
jgi:hypothetical protein